MSAGSTSLVAPILACVVGLWPVAALATNVSVPNADPAKLPVAEIQVVRSSDPDCRGRCSDWIAIQGPFGLGTAARFEQVIRGLGPRRLPVLIDSPGGSIPDAMAIGRLIRSKRLDIAVSKTVRGPCAGDRAACPPPPPGIVTGTPVTKLSSCASACSFVLAGGLRRYVALDTFVGVHQFRTYRHMARVLRLYRILTRRVNGAPVEISRTMIGEKRVSEFSRAVTTSAASYNDAAAYFTEMGISPKLMTLAEETPPTSIHWLSLAELVSTRMDTEGKDGAFLIAHPEGAPPPEVAVRSVSPAEPFTAENAFLVASASGAANNDIHGRVTWSATESSMVPTVSATVDLDRGAGQATIRIEAHDHAPDHEADRILVMFQSGPASLFNSVIAVGVPKVRFEMGSPPQDLDGSVTKTGSNAFEFDPPADPEAAEREAKLVLASDWLDIPVTVAPGRTVTLTVERGTTGTAAIREWRMRAEKAPPVVAPATKS